MSATITLIGNSGVEVATKTARIFIDAFYTPIARVAEAPSVHHDRVRQAHLILVSHPHPDHFSPAKLIKVAERTGALVAGPRAVIEPLRGKIHNVALIEMDPYTPHDGPAASMEVVLPGLRIVAFRTFHARHHNSYLIETSGFRFYHDGDNEQTRRVPREALGQLDALFVAPWKDSGWAELAQEIKPKRTILVHLTKTQIARHETGRLLPALCPCAPKGVMVLRGGESLTC